MASASGSGSWTSAVTIMNGATSTSSHCLSQPSMSASYRSTGPMNEQIAPRQTHDGGREQRLRENIGFVQILTAGRSPLIPSNVPEREFTLDDVQWPNAGIRIDADGRVVGLGTTNGITLHSFKKPLATWRLQQSRGVEDVGPSDPAASDVDQGPGDLVGQGKIPTGFSNGGTEPLQRLAIQIGHAIQP